LEHNAWMGCTVLADRALLARWRLADGCIWEIALNLSSRNVAWNRSRDTETIWSEPPDASRQPDVLPAHSAIVSATATNDRNDQFDA
jgi:maltooligosyltrehalose trehalohydrolase